jgi:hypothetical protein
MTKHIVGLIIFTLIVGTSAVIAGIFSYITTKPNVDTVTVYEDSGVYKRKKRCRKKRKPRPREISATVLQATFDAAGKKLTTEIFVSETDVESDLELHFFVKDAYGTQYLKKETITVSSEENLYENSFGWLNRLESKENLYIVAKVKRAYSRWDYQPRFDAEKATPVLILATD